MRNKNNIHVHLSIDTRKERIYTASHNSLLSSSDYKQGNRTFNIKEDDVEGWWDKSPSKISSIKYPRILKNRRMKFVVLRGYASLMSSNSERQEARITPQLKRRIEHSSFSSALY